MTTHTTTRIHLSYRDHARTWLAQRDPIALLSVLLIIMIIGLAMLRQMMSSPPTTIAAVPTPQLPIIMIATAPAELPTTAAPAPVQQIAYQPPPNTLSRAVVAYDSPNGSVIGAIEQGRAYQVLARFGADWLQADVSGSGVVWLRSADVFDLPTDLADLQPPPTPQVVYQGVNAPVVEQPAPALATPTERPIYALQTLVQSTDEEPLSPALLREAQDR